MTYFFIVGFKDPGIIPKINGKFEQEPDLLDIPMPNMFKNGSYSMKYILKLFVNKSHFL